MPGPLVELRARYVIPIDGPPIEGGCVAMRGDRFVSVSAKPITSDPMDLGDVAVLPGLINAHTHLDLNDVPGPLGRPGIGLVDWIGEVIRHRLTVLSFDHVVFGGLRESARLGTTTLADISQTAPAVVTSAAADIPRVRFVSFLELIAPTLDRVELQIERALGHIATGRDATNWLSGLSPHAPYSVRLDLLTQAVALSAEHHVPLAMHLAESREELELIEHRRGPFREFLERLGAWDAEAFPDGLTMLGYLRTLAGAHRALIVHGNYLGTEDMAFLARHADRMTVVYCPRTHAFFGHAPYPLEALLSAGVVVALGTDSRASSPDLSLLAEMRETARRHPSIDPAAILRLGTLGGATALGMSHRLGTITPGREADLTIVSLPHGACRNAADLYHELVESNTPVVATWLRGKPFHEDSFSERSNQ